MTQTELIQELSQQLDSDTFGTPLDEVRVRTFQSFFNHLFAPIPPGEGITTLWFDRDTSANAAINRDGPDAVLHCDAQTNQHAQLETTESINYAPGTIGVIGWAIRPETLPAGEQDVWAGPTNRTNGVGIGIKEFAKGEGRPATTFAGVQPYIFFEKAGQRIHIPQEHWNLDTLDGSGGPDNPSGYDINNLLDGVIVRVDPQLYYGHGEYTIKLLNKRGEQSVDLDGGGQLLLDDAELELIEAHRLVVTGDTMVDEVNVPIIARAETNGTAAPIDFHWTAAHYERATTEADVRLNGVTRRGVDVDAAWEPIISWQKRTGWERINSRPILVIVASDTDLTLDLQLGTSLNGASFGLPTHTTSSEVALEYDTSATGFAETGERRWIWQVTGGQGSQQGSGGGELGFNLPGGRTLSLAAKADADNATVDAVALTGSEF